jgi:DNA-directed RNA polymerase specialized sigma24 family protein
MSAVTKTRCWQKLRAERRHPNSSGTYDTADVRSDVLFQGILCDELESMLDLNRDRVLFRMLYREGMGATEVARHCGVPVVTVRKRQASLIGKLRRVVHPCMDPCE